MVVAGTQSAVLMVESEPSAREDQMLGAVLFAHQEMQAVINAINELKTEAANRHGTGSRKQKIPRSRMP